MSDTSDSPKRSFRQLRIPTGVARANTVYLFIIALVSVGTVLRLTGSIFIPFVIAVLLSFVFAPIVSFLVKRRVPRFIAITFVLLIFLAFGFLIALIIYSSFQSLLREFPTYQARFSQLLRDVIVRFDLPPDITSQLEITRTIGNTLLSFSGNFMSFASGFMVVMIFLLFLLMEKPYTRRKLTMAVRDETTRRLSRVLLHITSQIGRYVAVKLLVSTLTALVVYVLFSMIGVDFPFVWSVLTFLFNFIPSIGSVAITFISGIFAMVQFLPDWNPIIAAFTGMGLTQFVIGNVLDPKLLGDRLNLSPVIILLSLLLWGWLWGTAGLFLAVPLTVAIKIVFENVPGMEAFGILMGTGNFKPPRRHRSPEEAQPSE
ncbi:MAG: AI-2E family transporter [Alkalispirochaeta sp.]